jgi:hypothetical protein
MEAVMDIKKLARELADLRFESGYTFDNGTPFRETLGPDRAEGLLKALQAHGYVVMATTVESPSICEDVHRTDETVH